MTVTASLASKLDPTDRAGDMLSISDLVDQETDLVFKVQVTSPAVFVLGLVVLVLLHLLNRAEATRAIVESTGHISLERHCG